MGIEKNPIKSIEWIITDRCNYECSYCFQRSYAKRSHCSDEVTEASFGLFASLEGRWHIKLIGGEPLLHPRLLEMSEKIVEYGHCLSTTTNFSFPIHRLTEWSMQCGDRLVSVTASLHLNQVQSLTDFVGKCVAFNRLKSPGTHFAVTSVVTEDNFEQLKEIERDLDREGVLFAYQVMRVGGRFVKYPPEIEEHIGASLATNTSSLRDHRLFGTLCRTGELFFKIEVNGDAYRCLMPQALYSMGNITRGTFKRFARPLPCTSLICTCTTPANRNMILYGQKAHLWETVLAGLGGLPASLPHLSGKVRSRIRRRFRSR